MKHPNYIYGQAVRLRPAVLADRRQIFEAGARSELTDTLLGHPSQDHTPLLSYEEFCDDYKLHYFDDSGPERGRCFVIEVDGQALGQVNYNEIDRTKDRTELDIWMFGEQHCGQGYGSEALGLLCDYLSRELDVDGFLILPSASNPRAIRAYEKAGFIRTTLTNEQALIAYGSMDNIDTVYMTRNIEPVCSGNDASRRT